MVCEDEEDLWHHYCGEVLCRHCSDTYGDHCPGCGERVCGFGEDDEEDEP